MFDRRDRPSIETLMGEHVKAWSELADATMNVVALPARTLQALVTGESVSAPSPAERLAAAEAQIDELKAALAREWALHREREAAWQARLQDELAAVQDLRRAYARLEQDVEGRVSQALEDQKQAFYRIMDPLLTQLPVVKRSIDQGREMEAADLLALLGPLDNVLATWGFTPIGEVGAEAAFDPSLHQVANGKAPDAGAQVVVKHVGYRMGDQILRRARVTVKRDA